MKKKKNEKQTRTQDLCNSGVSPEKSFPFSGIRYGFALYSFGTFLAKSKTKKEKTANEFSRNRC